MKHFALPVWKTAPFVRILIPLVSGIMLQWYFSARAELLVFTLCCFLVSFVLFGFLPDSFKFSHAWIRGLLLHSLIIVSGMLLIRQNDIRQSMDWYGHHYSGNDFLVVKINETPVEKSKSYKAECLVETILNDSRAVNTKGKLLVYFAKDSMTKFLHYGDRVLIRKPLQPIKNSGNPGAFNYQRYAAFQQIFHNVFLKEKDWVKLKEPHINPFRLFIFETREKILSILQNTIGDNKDQLGIAEALLIGYTNDLDKDLIQAYSNTGVVHIIAISGMHLGLIYIMLAWIFARIPYIKNHKFSQVILILSCLWLFSLLTGGSASVLRSAVMFTFITIGKNAGKQTPVYNSLAASAFMMLCYNPYYLWDVGFQLSYFAVVGIVIFQKPVYNIIYVKNKWLDKVWQLVAVSLSAQVFTFPICIYYFHQFPNLFLITNMIAVPLSSVILFAEIALVAFSWIPWFALYAGKSTAWLVWVMNKVILYVNSFPFAVWDQIPATVYSTWVLYAVVFFSGAWLLYRKKDFLKHALVLVLCFTVIQIYGKWQTYSQQKLIVYNVPRLSAIDFVNGNMYMFIGDSTLLNDGMLQNFHLKPARIFMQLKHRINEMNNVHKRSPFYQFNNKRILMIDGTAGIADTDSKIDIDIVVISKNPGIRISELVKNVNCKKIIFDSSNSLWKIGKWQKECEELLLPCYSVPERGAFIMDADS